MRTVFFGNHTLGIRSLQALGRLTEVVGVVAHPDDPEDGSVYDSLYMFAKGVALPAIRGRGRDVHIHTFARQAKPDLIWIAGYRYLLPPECFGLAPLGAVNLHPSRLPAYRGRAPLNWAILKGESQLALTAHFVDEGINCGDIIEQMEFDLGADQDVGDALRLLDPLYTAITERVVDHFLAGAVPRRPQDLASSPVWPNRKSADGVIDWTRPAGEIHDLVRAVAAPYPGAFTALGRARLVVWKAAAQGGDDGAPGTVLAVTADGVHVQCGRGTLIVGKFEFEGVPPLPELTPGVVLGRGGENDG